jgi:hypothetical protein
MTTVQDSNGIVLLLVPVVFELMLLVHCLSVDGTFDDCQVCFSSINMTAIDRM